MDELFSHSIWPQFRFPRIRYLSFKNSNYRNNLAILLPIIMPNQSITYAHRRALRRWFKQQYPKLRQRDCIPWFEKQYKHRLAASTVSDILSDRYSYLDQVRNPRCFINLDTNPCLLLRSPPDPPDPPDPPTVSELRSGLF